MAENTIRGYVLTYMGWALAMLTALPSALLVTYLLFRNFFPAWSEVLDAEGSILAMLAASIGAVITFFVIFQTILLVASAIYVRLFLKGYPARRSATIAWLCGLLFFTPLVSFIDLVTGTIIILTSLWLMAAPGLARWLALRGHVEQPASQPADTSPQG